MHTDRSFRSGIVAAAALTLGLVLLSLTALIACPAAKAPKPKPQPPVDLIAAGSKLYGQACSSCHGADARGGDGPSLHGIRLDKDAIESQIRRGTPGEMPSFARRFQQGELDSLTAYIKSLPK